MRLGAVGVPAELDELATEMLAAGSRPSTIAAALSRDTEAVRLARRIDGAGGGEQTQRVLASIAEHTATARAAHEARELAEQAGSSYLEQAREHDERMQLETDRAVLDTVLEQPFDV